MDRSNGLVNVSMPQWMHERYAKMLEELAETARAVILSESPPPAKLLKVSPAWCPDYLVSFAIKRENEVSVDEWLHGYFSDLPPSVFDGLVSEYGSKLELLFGPSFRVIVLLEPEATQAPSQELRRTELRRNMLRREMVQLRLQLSDDAGSLWNGPDPLYVFLASSPQHAQIKVILSCCSDYSEGDVDRASTTTTVIRLRRAVKRKRNETLSSEAEPAAKRPDGGYDSENESDESLSAESGHRALEARADESGTSNTEMTRGSESHAIFDEQDDEERQNEFSSDNEKGSGAKDLPEMAPKVPVTSSGGPDSSAEHAILRSFPHRLYAVLSSSENNAITWQTHGRSWRMKDRKLFETHLLQKEFNLKAYSSFLKEVKAWGFRRVPAGPDYNTYYHEVRLQRIVCLSRRIRASRFSMYRRHVQSFVRGIPQLCDKITRLSPKDVVFGKNETLEDAPDFSRLSIEHTLSSALGFSEPALSQKTANINSDLLADVVEGLGQERSGPGTDVVTAANIEDASATGSPPTDAENMSDDSSTSSSESGSPSPSSSSSSCSSANLQQSRPIVSRAVDTIESVKDTTNIQRKMHQPPVTEAHHSDDESVSSSHASELSGKQKVGPLNVPTQRTERKSWITQRTGSKSWTTTTTGTVRKQIPQKTNDSDDESISSRSSLSSSSTVSSNNDNDDAPVTMRERQQVAPLDGRNPEQQTEPENDSSRKVTTNKRESFSDDGHEDESVSSSTSSSTSSSSTCASSKESSGPSSSPTCTPSSESSGPPFDKTRNQSMTPVMTGITKPPMEAEDASDVGDASVKPHSEPTGEDGSDDESVSSTSSSTSSSTGSSSSSASRSSSSSLTTTKVAAYNKERASGLKSGKRKPLLAVSRKIVIDTSTQRA
jgi:hypothetical protein